MTFAAKAEAATWLATVETDLFRGEHVDPAGRSQLFGPYAQAWLAAKSGLRSKTQESYEYLLRVHLLLTFRSARGRSGASA